MEALGVILLAIGVVLIIATYTDSTADIVKAIMA